MYIVRVLIIVVLSVSSLGSLEAASLNSAMQDCAKIKRDLKRLACFDRLSGRVDTFAQENLTPTQQQATTRQTPQQSSRPEVVASAPRTAEAGFGMESQSAASQLEVITSYIPGDFSGWEKNDEITLANGQVWKLSSSASKLFHKATNPRVEIRRGVLGSFRIKIIGLNRTAQVKRIK